MSTFKTSLKILWAHRVHIRRYLVLLSMFGLLAAGGGASAASDEVIDAPIPVAVIDRDGSTISQGVARYVESIGDAQPLEDSTRALQDATAQNRIAYTSSSPPATARSSRRRPARGPSRRRRTPWSTTSPRPDRSWTCARAPIWRRCTTTWEP